jgi:hypothetical protein
MFFIFINISNFGISLYKKFIKIDLSNIESMTLSPPISSALQMLTSGLNLAPRTLNLLLFSLAFGGFGDTEI